MSPNSFTAGPVGYRTALAVLDGAVAAGLLNHQPGIRYLREVDGFGERPSGRASRFWATDLLLAMAARHGITPAAASRQFPRHYPKRAARVTRLVDIVALDPRRGGPRTRGGAVQLPIPKTAEARRMVAEVRLANKVLAEATWTGAQPPQLYRKFRRDFTLGGRWYVAGAAPIQTMAAAERLRIQVSGQPVAEVDVKASHLAILATFAGMTTLPDEPYGVPGYTRGVVKKVVMAAVGIGTLPAAWPETMPEMADIDIAPIIVALAEAYPFLARGARLLGVPKAVVGLRLQAIEAEALTQAMLPLWRAGVPVVPVHDSLIVPAPAADWAAANLVAAYAARCGANIRVTRHGYGNLTKTSA